MTTLEQRSIAARLLIAGTALALLGACTTLATSGTAADAPALDSPRYEASVGTATPRVALVLSGGAARAFAHLGVLRVLEREGLRPDLVVGSSAGAIVGAYYASGMPVAKIEEEAARLALSTLIDINPLRIAFGAYDLGYAKGDRLEAFIRESVDRPMQSLPTRFAALATDLNTGERVLLTHGDTARAVRASSSVPALYEPVRAAGRLLGDGQITSPLPVDAARQLGARVVVAVDVAYPPTLSTLTGPMSVMFQSLAIASYRHLLIERERADVVVIPEIPDTGDLALSDRDWLIAAGESAAQRMLPALRAAFATP